MPRPTKKSKQKQADMLFSQIIRSKGYCEAMGKDDVKCGGPLQCAHVEGRRNKYLRWDRLNAICLCAGHHRYYTDYPIAWGSLIRSHFPIHFWHVEIERCKLWDRDIDAVLARLKAEYEAVSA